MPAARLRERRSRLLRESLVETTLPCGLRVVIFSKPGFVKRAAMASAAYGSLDIAFDADGRGPQGTPEGIAHFLEHQLFKKERGDLLMEYGAQGASANAFTYYNQTTFYFTSAGPFDPCLDLLLETVFAPWFSPDGVAKEKLIIEQELRMYNDQPDHRLYRALMTALYRQHPVRDDIGGTVESIQQIDAELLERCWRTFYHPSNVTFVAAGDVDPGALVASLERALPPDRVGPGRPIRRFYEEEPAGVSEARVRRRAAISRPQVLIGFKDLTCARRPPVERDLATTVALDLLFGRAGDWYTKRYASGLVDDTFSFSYLGETSFGFTLLGGEADDPERLADEVLAQVRRARRSKFRRADVERAKRKRIGRYLRAFNSPEEAAFLVLGYVQRDMDVFAVPERIDALTANDLDRVVREHLDPANAVVSLLHPE